MCFRQTFVIIKTKPVHAFYLLFFDPDIHFICLSCNKNPSQPVEPEPPIIPGDTTHNPPYTGITVDNKWQCEVDGVQYFGTIDTSFSKMGPDTLINCTGTSNDKKSNISFWIRINRRNYANSISSQYNANFSFDTSSTDRWVSTLSNEINFKVDSIESDKLKGFFRRCCG